MSDPRSTLTIPAASLRALLSGAIDDAGMFPPAGLPLERAASRHRSHGRSDESWMLGRFVCPAASLDALARIIDEASKVESPWTVAAVRRIAGGETSGDAVEIAARAIAADAEAIASFNERFAGRARVDALEAAPPPSLVEPSDFERLALRIDPPRGASVFVELPDERASAGKAAEALRAIGRAGTIKRGARIGAKLRCGGPSSADHPSAAHVAAILAARAEVGASLKLTAGLHHPLPRRDEATGARVHGFLNVLIAALLADRPDVNRTEIVEALEDDRAENFTFGETAISWRGRSIDLETIARGRAEAVVGFGSCSFAEPVEDLRSLGLL
jgi:hypothetical protein